MNIVKKRILTLLLALAVMTANVPMFAQGDADTGTVPTALAETELASPESKKQEIQITFSADTYQTEGNAKTAVIEKIKVNLYEETTLNRLADRAAISHNMGYSSFERDEDRIWLLGNYATLDGYVWTAYINGQSAKMTETVKAGDVVNLVHKPESFGEEIPSDVDQEAFDDAHETDLDVVFALEKDKVWIAEQNLLGENSTSDAIKANLSLPTKAKNSCIIGWESSRPDVIDSYGNVYRLYLSEDTKVALKALLYFQEEDGSFSEDSVEIGSFTVLAPSEDERAILIAKDSVYFGAIRGENTGINQIDRNLSLMTELEGCQVTWLSSNPDVITNEGVVIRPDLGESPVSVTMTAQIVKGDVSDSTSLDLTVIPLTTQWYAAKGAAEHLELGDTTQVVKRLSLPDTVQSATYPDSQITITWSSDNESLISSTGEIARPEVGAEPASATLTATVQADGSRDIATKAFVVTILPLSQEDAKDKEAARAEAEEKLSLILAPEAIQYENLDLVMSQIEQAQSALSSAVERGYMTYQTTEFNGYENIANAEAAMAVLPRDITFSVLGASYDAATGKVTYLEEDFVPKTKIKISPEQNLFQVLLMVNKMHPEFGMDPDDGNYKFRGLGRTISPDGRNMRWMYFIDGAQEGEQFSGTVLSHNQSIKWAYVDFENAVNTGFPASKDGYDVPFGPEKTVDFDFVAPTLNAANALKVEELLNGNAAADQITSDLSLPKVGYNNASITWKSSNPEVITDDGKLVNYILISGDKRVTMTATIKMEANSYQGSVVYPEQEKKFDFVIRSSEASNDEKAVRLAIESLSLGDTSLVTDNLTLPQKGVLDTEITWQSSDVSVITDKGVITRPGQGQENAQAVLTASVRKNETVLETTFTVTVKALEKSGADAVSYDTEALTFESIKGENQGADAITKPLTLPQSGYQGSQITWSAKPENAVAADGTLRRPQPGEGDSTVTLTAAIEKDGASQTKTFTLVLPAMSQEEAVIDAALCAFAAVPDAEEITEATRDTLQAKEKIKQAKTAYTNAINAGVLPENLPGYDRVLEADKKMHMLPSYITISIIGDIDDDPKTETMGYFHKKEKVRVPANWSLMQATKAIVEGDGADVVLTYGGAFLQSMYGGKGPWMYGVQSDVVGAWNGAAGYPVEHEDVIYWYQVYTQKDVLTELKDTKYDERISTEEPYTLDLVTDTVDKSALKEAIAQAESLKQEDYRNYASWSTTWDDLQNALQYARDLVESKDSIQYDVDKAYNKLLDAMDALEPYVADKTQLNAEIAKANELKEKEYQEGWADLLEALRVAQQVTDSPYSSVKETQDAQEALTAAIIALVPLGNTTDKTELKAKVAAIQKLKKEAYTDISWKKLESAYEYATTILAKGNAAQSEADEALAMLEKAESQLLTSSPETNEERIAVSIETLGESFVGSVDPWKVMDMAYAGRSKDVDKAAFMAEALEIIQNENSSSTDLQRTALALTAIGVHVGKIDDGQGGTINLLDMIANDKRTLQVNALTFALVALDSGAYEIANDAIWTREKLIDNLLGAQLQDGGWTWSLTGDVSDVDMTSMVISALAPYYNGTIETDRKEKVFNAVDSAMVYLKGQQKNNGAFGYGSEENPDSGNSDSTAMVILAASTLGRDAAVEFSKKTGPFPFSPTVSCIQGLYTFETADHQFGYTDNKEVNDMATEQVYRALLTYQNYLTNPQPQSPYWFKAPTQGNVVDKDALREKALNLEGIKKDNYTDETWKAFQRALQDAKDILDSTSATQEQTDDALFALMSAYRRLSTGSGSEFVDTQAPIITTTAKNETVTKAQYTFQALGKDAIEGDMPVHVTLNGIAVKGLNGYFTVELTSGTNTIVITSQDYSGNMAEKTIKVVYKTGSIGGDGGGGVTTIGVSIKIVGDKSTILSTKELSVSKGKTAFDALKKAADAAKIKIDYVGSGSTIYVKGIDGLYEFDRGQNSGWLYSVNGVYPNKSAGAYTLKDGDEIIWKYTVDYTKEDGLDIDNSGTGSGSQSGKTITKKANNGSAVFKASELKSAGTLKVQGDISITIDQAALKEIGTTKDITVEISKISANDANDQAKALIGERPVYSVSILYGDKAIEQLKTGKITVTIPYEAATGEEAARLAAYTLNAQGTAEKLSESKYDAKNKSIIFDIKAPATFVIGYEASSTSTILFKDVPNNHWAQIYIYALAEQGILKGKTETTFGPEDFVTRAEFTALLSRISGESAIAYTGRFEDVKASDWYAGDVAWAVKAGVVKGVTEEEFAPDANITREQMAVMLARFAAYLNFTLPVKDQEVLFDDSDSIASYAKEAVTALQKAGIINGKGDNTFAPKGLATRAQAAKMLSVLLSAMQ